MTEESLVPSIPVTPKGVFSLEHRFFWFCEHDCDWLVNNTVCL